MNAVGVQYIQDTVYFLYIVSRRNPRDSCNLISISVYCQIIIYTTFALFLNGKRENEHKI